MAAGRMVYVKAKPKTSRMQTGHWSEKKKYEACCLWSSGMKMSQVSVETGVPYETIKQWRSSTWWADIHKELQSEDKQQLDARLTKILDKTLDSILDRLENGEFVYDQKTGSLKRSPVKLRDATVAMNTVMDKRQLIRKEPTKIVESESTNQQLANLAKQFQEFVTGKKQEEKDKPVYIDNVTVEQGTDGVYYVKEE